MNTTRLVEEEWQSEFAAGFPILSTIPSSYVQRFLATITEHDYGVDFVIRQAQRLLSPNELELFCLQINGYGSPARFSSYRELKPLIQALQELPSNDIIRQEIAEATTILNGITIPTATEVRKVLFPILGEVAASKPKNLGRGNWNIPLTHRGSTLALSVDFGGMHSGFRWNIDLRPSQFGLPKGFPWVSYERWMGIPDPYWDQISHANLEASGRLLCALVKKTLEWIE